jgi:hypothetical protein
MAVALVCIAFGVVRGHFARSLLRRDVAFSLATLPAQTKRCVYPQLDIKGASICCTERGYISAVS